MRYGTGVFPSTSEASMRREENMPGEIRRLDASVAKYADFAQFMLENRPVSLLDSYRWQSGLWYLQLSILT